MNEIVSVIIPTYNRKNFIIQAIESVINQTYKNLEIIVIDDGSSDNTKETLKDYILNNKIKYFYKENSGVSNTRNYGIEKSTGSFLAFLDSDDFWKHDKIEKQINLFKSNDKLGLVHTCYTTLLDNQEITKHPDNPNYYQGKVFEKMIQFNMVATSTVVIKKECIEKSGLFFQEYSPCEDYDLWIKISKYYEFAYLNEALAFYRENSTNNISKNLDKFEKGAISIFDKNWNEIKDTEQLKLKNKAYSRFYSYLSTFYYQQNNLTKFEEYYIKASNLEIGNHLSLPESIESIKYLLEKIKDHKTLSYTYMRLARQSFVDKKMLVFTKSIFCSFIYNPIGFYNFFIKGFIFSYLKKL